MVDEPWTTEQIVAIAIILAMLGALALMMVRDAWNWNKLSRSSDVLIGGKRVTPLPVNTNRNGRTS